MKSVFVFFFFIFSISALQAQYTLRLGVTNTSLQKDEIYLAGNFNGWNPGDSNYKLKSFGNNSKYIELNNVYAGMYEFKFTRGSWEKVETTAKGEDITNHFIQLSSDTSLIITVAGWKDNFPVKPKPNTASANVHIIDTAFYITQLKRYRRIWIYLPAGYHSSKKYYPVLYMHDGQNLFNEQTSGFGEWGIDECLDTLENKLQKECIVVGIDNGTDKRMTEYNPYDNQRFGKGEGKLYIDFLAETLKPFVDSNYRTLIDASHTFIAGSSMGGLISLYAIVQYPDVFGVAGIFSPAFWIVPEMFQGVQNATWNQAHRFYFYAGGKESETMITDMEKMVDIILKKNCCATLMDANPLGQHNEKFWRNEFDDFYYWLMQ